MSVFVRQMMRSDYQMERYVYRAVAALPGAGVFTADGLFVLPDVSLKKLVLWCLYTRGAANGQAAFRVLFEDRLFIPPPPVAEEARDIVLDQTLAVAQPEDNQSFYQQTLYGPVCPGAITDITFAMIVDIPPGTVGVRVLAAEIGVVATPGTLRIAFTGGS